LIDSLDEATSAFDSWGGGWARFDDDPRVKALVALGDAAVPALIEAIENDDRLTRSVVYLHRMSSARRVIAAREAAEAAVSSILRVRQLDPTSAPRFLSVIEKDQARQMAALLRSYWREYGGLPFDERLMKVLTDPGAKGEALREAAANLARLGEEDGRLHPRTGPHPAVAKFQRPTAAEAILAAMDRDLAACDDPPTDPWGREVDEIYLNALKSLHDERILPALRERSATTLDPRLRRKWATACHALCDAKPLKAFARDFRAGKVGLPPDKHGRPDGVELGRIIATLAAARTEETDLALMALADPAHPHNALTSQKLLEELPGWGVDAWFSHTYSLPLLRKALADPAPTQGVWEVKGDTLYYDGNKMRRQEPLPDLLADPTRRRDRAEEHACDAAAHRLSCLVLGVPPYHPLLRDTDDRLRAVKDTFDRFRGRYRRLSEDERSQLGLSGRQPEFVADVGPLGRAAAEFDVCSGQAIFHLDGKGKPTNLRVPAVGVLRRSGKEERVLVVQAEVGADGETVYGIIGRHEVRAAKAKEVAKVTTLTPKKEP
jgi:hypothetical protein